MARTFLIVGFVMNLLIISVFLADKIVGLSGGLFFAGIAYALWANSIVKKQRLRWENDTALFNWAYIVVSVWFYGILLSLVLYLILLMFRSSPIFGLDAFVLQAIELIWIGSTYVTLENSKRNCERASKGQG